MALDPTPQSTRRALQEAGFLFQLALMALLPLVNALYFDWDAGMVAGLVIAEALLMLALLPLLWTALEWRYQRGRPQAGRVFRWPRRLLANLFGGLLILAVGGVLPTVFLSVLAPDWMEWTSNHAVTHLGVPAVLTLFLWPFLLGWLIWPDWPSYSLSLAAVVLMTLVHMAGLCWLALSTRGDPDSVEDEATALLNLSTFPLFLMAAIAYAISRWLAEERLFLPPLDRVDLALWTLVLLSLMRGLAGPLLRHAQQAGRAHRQGRAGLARRADRRLLFGLGIALAVVPLAGLGLLLASSARQVTPAAESLRADCLASWPGQFAESSRAALDPRDQFSGLSADLACERILAARSLRLQQAVDPDDLARFQGLEKLELVGPAVIHAADLHRLAALDEVYFTRPGVLDVALLRPPPSLTGVVVVDASLRSAEQLWQMPGVERVMLDRVRIEQAAAIPGRTTLQGLALRAVDGELDSFLHGAIGLRQLILRSMPPDVLGSARLHHLRRLAIEPAPSSADYCAAIARWHSIRGEAARACGHRFAIPD